MARGVRAEVDRHPPPASRRLPAAVAEIMRRVNLKSAIVVSDGYHIRRVKPMLESSGLQVYGSPRPSAPSGN